MRHFAGVLIVWSLLTSTAVARPDEPVSAVAETVLPQMAVLSGRVLLKDGVTPVQGAGLVLTGVAEDAQFQEKSGRGGRYKIHLPVGNYRLQIVRGMDVYTSPSVYRVSAGVRNQIDFMIIPDFEKSPGSDQPDKSAKRGPDPAPAGPVEVGTIVDAVHEHAAGRWRRWAETLGFIGSVLFVALAAG